MSETMSERQVALGHRVAARLILAPRKVSEVAIALAGIDDDEGLAELLVAELAKTVGLTDPRVADAMQLLWRLGAALEEAIDDAVAAAVAPPEENPA